MTAVDPQVSAHPRAVGQPTARDVVAAYVGLMKPRIIELLLLTTVPVMFLAQGGVPPLGLVVATVLGGTVYEHERRALPGTLISDLKPVRPHDGHRRNLHSGRLCAASTAACFD